jgi:ABC-type branched-subunit amino acid transport system ATPase component
MADLFECRDVCVSYGPVKAVAGVSFSLRPGTVLGIIGPNGAGKTSLVDVLSGFTPLAGGSVSLRGRDISALPPHRRARLGLVRTWQSVELYEDLTVRENLLVAADSPRWWTMLTDIVRPGRRVANDGEVHDIIRVLDLEADADRMVGEIPQDKRKIVGIARVLAAKPSLVLMDEPAAGLNTAETAGLGRRLRRMADDGLAIMLIEHDVDLVASVCDQIVVLEFGQPIAQGSPEEVLSDSRVIAAYLGDSRGVPGEKAVTP